MPKILGSTAKSKRRFSAKSIMKNWLWRNTQFTVNHQILIVQGVSKWDIGLWWVKFAIIIKFIVNKFEASELECLKYTELNSEHELAFTFQFDFQGQILTSSNLDFTQFSGRTFKNWTFAKRCVSKALLVKKLQVLLFFVSW